MNRKELSELLKAVPFQPFTIKMSTGDEHHVGHAEVAGLGNHTIIVWEPLEDGSDRFFTLSYLHITQIEKRPQASA